MRYKKDLQRVKDDRCLYRPMGNVHRKCVAVVLPSLWPWRWRQYVPPKYESTDKTVRSIFSGRHKYIHTSVETSNFVLDILRIVKNLVVFSFKFWTGIQEQFLWTVLMRCLTVLCLLYFLFRFVLLASVYVHSTEAGQPLRKPHTEPWIRESVNLNEKLQRWRGWECDSTESLRFQRNNPLLFRIFSTQPLYRRVPVTILTKI